MSDGISVAKGKFARQQSRAAHVRFGSKADIQRPLSDVRFTPKSGHRTARVSRSAHLLRQLGDIRRDPQRLVPRQQLGRRSPAA